MGGPLMFDKDDDDEAKDQEHSLNEEHFKQNKLKKVIIK